MRTQETRTPHRLVILLLLLALSALSLGAAPAAAAFPEVIPLPNGWQPEGIAVGRGHTFYVGSLANGAIYQGDLRTGSGNVLVPGEVGRVTVGIKVDDRTNYIFAAGGPTGQAYVFDADTGATLATLQLTTGPAFINDVAITRDAAYFTNSFAPVLYRVPLEAGGRLPAAPTFVEIPLGGEFDFIPGGFNANGIAATPNGEWLIVVNSTAGALYRVDPATGVAERIDLGGGSVPAGDGILLQGHTLYVVQNQLNQVAVVELSPDLLSGEIVDTITSQYFRVPTTIARFGTSLYAVNARFGTPPTPDTEYEVVQVSR